MKTTYYSVQVNDDDFPKKIPHTGKKYCEFLDRKKATAFMENLIMNNPSEKFRILKRIEIYEPEKWQQQIPPDKKPKHQEG